MTRIAPQSAAGTPTGDPSTSQQPLAPDTLVSVMSSLADATRLRLLRLLEKQELGVAELCEILQMPQSTVSRHLKLLAGEAWINSRRHGTANLYRMTLDELSDASRQLWLLARDRTAGSAVFRQDELRLTRLLQRRRQAGDDFFAAAADDWDRLRVEYYGHAVTHHALLGLLPHDWTVADLGCGTGDATAALARCVHQVIGIDRSAEMLEAAAQRTADLSNVDLRAGDLEDLPLESASCDAAVMVLVLTYLPQPQAALCEAARILKPDGRLVVVDLLQHDREDFRRQMGQAATGFDPDVLAHMLQEAGLAHPRVSTLTPEPDARGPALMMAVATKPSPAQPSAPH